MFDNLKVANFELAALRYPQLFGEDREATVPSLATGKTSGTLLAEVRGVSLGSLYLLDLPLSEAMIRNTPVFCGFGFRLRNGGQDARIEVVEHSRFDGPLEAPHLFESAHNDATSLLIGTLVFSPRGLYAPTPRQAREDVALWGCPIEHKWKYDNIEVAAILLPEETWLSSFPDEVRGRARGAVQEHCKEIDGVIGEMRSRGRFYLPLEHLGRLRDLGFVSSQEHEECLWSLRHHGLLVKIGDLGR